MTGGYGDGGRSIVASISQRIRAFLQSPQGRQVIERGRRELAKPDNQRKLRDLVGRFASRRR
jgi:hypothetical protein